MKLPLRALPCALALIVGLSHLAYPQGRHTISGFVHEKGSRETLIGVNVFVEGTTTGTSTNSFGFFSLSLPAGKTRIVFSSVGYQQRVFEIDLTQSMELQVELDPSLELEGVMVVGELSKRSSRSAHMSVLEIPVHQLKAIPALLGEKDALKVIQLMPGVKKGAEGTGGLYVRGGGPDQNLIILDGAPVYNAFHLFGFFSIFNGDAIKSLELTKGGFPARYGGRLSSVLDITMKDGNMQRYAGEVGIGFISSRAVIEGPIVKDTASFLISGRRTYFDLLMRPFMPRGFRAGYFFYDLTAKANWIIDSRNRVFLSGYFGQNKFFGGESYDMGEEYEAGLYWGNITSTLRWNRKISGQLFSNLSLIFSQYRMSIYALETFMGYRYEMRYFSGIRDLGLKYDFTWVRSPSYTMRYGLASTWHRFTPSAFVLRDDELNEFTRTERVINTLASAAYVENEVKFGDRGIANLGLRLSGLSHDEMNSFRLEPRLSGSYFLNPVTSVKASYALMNQYVHLLSHTGIGLPTDLWVPATKNIPPQTSWQVALGLARDVPRLATTLSLEGYYKESNNVIGYREGASFLVLDDPALGREVSWEDNITSGRGWSYGLELLAHRKAGRLSGWVGYTLSWTQLQFAELNQGRPFFARYDRRHDVSVVGIFELNDNITLSATWVYGTGSAVTLPLATFPHFSRSGSGGFFDTLYDYGEKNSFRMAPYHRLDIGVQFRRQRRFFERTWEIGVYNAYSRKNPFFYYIDHAYRYRDGAEYRYNRLAQVSLFPLIPAVTYSIRF